MSHRDYFNQKGHAGMDYLTEVACSLIHATNKCKNKEEVVRELYNCHKDVIESEQRLANEMAKKNRNYKIDEAYIEEYLLTAVFAEKKLTWEDIQYCHEHSFLPLNVIKKPFPVDELEQELLKEGYTLTDDNGNAIEM